MVRKELESLESTVLEVEGKENHGRLSMLPSCNLPQAVYTESSTVTENVEEPNKFDKDYNYIADAYGGGSSTSSATVTRHVARVQVPRPLVWNDDLLAADESANSTPSVARFKQPTKSVLKQTKRDSGLFNESMMDMSVRETKPARKKPSIKGSRQGRGKK